MEAKLKKETRSYVSRTHEIDFTPEEKQILKDVIKESLLVECSGAVNITDIEVVHMQLDINFTIVTEYGSPIEDRDTTIHFTIKGENDG